MSENADSVNTATEIIPNRASVYTEQRLWRREFCDGTKLCGADLESGASHIE